MKKAMLLGIALLLLLTGCERAPGQGSLDSDRNTIHYELTFKDVCATEDTVYFRCNQLVHYYDKESGVSGVLCGKAECEHSTAPDSSCNAYVGNVKGMSLYGGRLYWMNDKSISSMAPDGTDHRTERAISLELFASQRGMGAVFHRGYMYLWIKNCSVEDGAEIIRLDVAAIPLDSEEEATLIYSHKLGTYASVWDPVITIQAYGDDLYILENLAVRSEGREDAYPTVYDFSILRYSAKTGEVDTLYHDEEANFYRTEDLWAMEEGIVFLCHTKGASPHTYRLDYATGELHTILDGGVSLGEDLIVSRNYRYEKSSPTNPWGMTLAPQDIEVSGDFQVTLWNFAGEVMLDGSYPLSGIYEYPTFMGADDTYAYFLSDATYSEHHGITHYMSILGVALDGSGMEVLCTEEEYYEFLGTNGSGESSRTMDDGTTINVKYSEAGTTITIIPGDGGETVRMSLEEFLEKGYQP